jgi:hypothetical protein
VNSTYVITEIFHGLTHGFCVDWNSGGDCDTLESSFAWDRLTVPLGYTGSLKELFEQDQSPTIIHYLSIGPDVSTRVLSDYLESPRIVFNHEQIIQVISVPHQLDLKGYSHYDKGIYVHNQWWYLTQMR